MKKIQRICYLFLLLLTAASLHAQSLPQAQTTMKARDAFRQMPDSILPYLTENNRLDMLDFMDSHMSARVQNKFDGYSEMLTLSDDSLTIQMSSVMHLTLRMVTSDTEVDGSRQLICLERTISHSAPDTTEESERKNIQRQDFYSVLWRKIDKTPAR